MILTDHWKIYDSVCSTLFKKSIGAVCIKSKLWCRQVSMQWCSVARVVGASDIGWIKWKMPLLFYWKSYAVNSGYIRAWVGIQNEANSHIKCSQCLFTRFQNGMSVHFAIVVSEPRRNPLWRRLQCGGDIGAVLTMTPCSRYVSTFIFINIGSIYNYGLTNMI